MKIGLVTEALGSYISGGIGYIVNVLNCLTEQGHDACLFLLKSPYTSEWLEAKFPIYPINSLEFENFEGVLSCEFSPVAKIVSEHKKSQDRFYHVHTNEGLFAYNGPEWLRMAQESYKLPLKIFCTSHYVRILMEQAYNRNCIGQLVPPGVDFSVFNTDDRGIPNYTKPPLRGFRACTNIGFFARPGHIRGTDIAFNVMRLMSFNSSLNPASYNFIQIPDGIRDRRQLANFYKQIDVFIDPSRLSGKNTCVLEAMACGAIVIGTPFGNIDTIVNGLNGWIVPVDNSPTIENRIKNYLQLPDHSKRQMHELALEAVKPYSWESVTSMFLNVIQEGLERKDLLEQKKWM